MDRHVQPQGMAPHERAKPDAVQCLQQVFVRQCGIGQVEVIAQCTVEQRHVLGQVADAALTVGRVDLPEAHIVEQQAPRLRLVKPLSRRNSDDLPAPLPPSKATRSPALMVSACTFTTGGLSPWARRTPSSW